MKKKDLKRLQKEVQNITNEEEKKLDKMSLSFVLPMIIFYAVVGLLLILLDELVTNVAAWALAAGLVIIGGWFLLRYFRSSPKERTAGMDLAIGLIVLLAGILLICSPSDMKEIFPKIWGLSLLFGGFLKIQYAFDEKTVDVNRWWIMLIFAAVSLAIGVLALLNRKVFGDSQNIFIGAFMLAEAVLDFVTWFLISRGVKRQEKPMDIPASASAYIPETPSAGSDSGD